MIRPSAVTMYIRLLKHVESRIFSQQAMPVPRFSFVGANDACDSRLSSKRGRCFAATQCGCESRHKSASSKLNSCAIVLMKTRVDLQHERPICLSNLCSQHTCLIARFYYAIHRSINQNVLESFSAFTGIVSKESFLINLQRIQYIFSPNNEGRISRTNSRLRRIAYTGRSFSAIDWTSPIVHRRYNCRKLRLRPLLFDGVTR